MTDKQIIEGNRLIAEFMKYHKVELISGDKYNFPELDVYVTIDAAKFHSSWDWLMPVMEKIRDEYKMVTTQNTINWILSRHNLKFWNTIEDVWLALVEFIKHYNTTPQ